MTTPASPPPSPLRPDRLGAVARLDAAGLPRPPVLVTVEDVTHGKPHPEGYLTAASRLAVEPSACLVVEDSIPGITAARSAGMPVAALRGLDGDLQIPHLSALTTWLRPPPPDP